MLSVSSECTLSTNDGIIDWKLKLLDLKKKRKHLSKRKLIMSMTDYYLWYHWSSCNLSITYIYKFEALLDIWICYCTWCIFFILCSNFETTLVTWFLVMKTCSIFWRIDLFCLFFLHNKSSIVLVLLVILTDYNVTCLSLCQQRFKKKFTWLNDAR